MRLGLIPRPQGVSFPHQNYGMQLMNLILLHVTDIQSLMHENYKELHLNEWIMNTPVQAKKEEEEDDSDSACQVATK